MILLEDDSPGTLPIEQVNLKKVTWQARKPTCPQLLDQDVSSPDTLWFNFTVLSVFLTALFTNMRIQKFKSQLTIAFFTAVNHLIGPLRKQNFTLTGSKGHGL